MARDVDLSKSIFKELWSQHRRIDPDAAGAGRLGVASTLDSDFPDRHDAETDFTIGMIQEAENCIA